MASSLGSKVRILPEAIISGSPIVLFRVTFPFPVLPTDGGLPVGGRLAPSASLHTTSNNCFVQAAFHRTSPWTIWIQSRFCRFGPFGAITSHVATTGRRRPQVAAHGTPLS